MPPPVAAALLLKVMSVSESGCAVSANSAPPPLLSALLPTNELPWLRSAPPAQAIAPP